MVNAIHEDQGCDPSTCTARLDVADVKLSPNLLSQVITIRYDNTQVDDVLVTQVVPGDPKQGEANYIIVSHLNPGLPTCQQLSPNYCGSIAESNYQENFTLAGGPKDQFDTTHLYYTLYADFWNTWQQAALQKVERYCIHESKCQGTDILDNDYVDALG